MHIVLTALGLAALVGLYLWLQKQERAPALPAPRSEFEREVSAAEFDQMVLAASHSVPVLVDFYARWCGPCHRFLPVMAGMARDQKGAFLLARLNFDTSRDLVQRYQVDCVPTVILFRGGERIDSFEGGRSPHQLRHFLATNGVAVI